MNWEEAVNIALADKGLSRLPIPGEHNPTRYEVSQQAWKIYLAAGEDPRKISFRIDNPDNSRQEIINRTSHEKLSHNTASDLFSSSFNRTSHENKPDRINRTLQGGITDS